MGKILAAVCLAGAASNVYMAHEAYERIPQKEMAIELNKSYLEDYRAEGDQFMVVKAESWVDEAERQALLNKLSIVAFGLGAVGLAGSAVITAGEKRRKNASMLATR